MFFSSPNDDICLVFEYCEYDLHAFIRFKTKISISQSKCYFKQLLSGLQYCHSQSIIHRDLKPSNILLSSSNSVKLTDFGLSSLVEEDSSKMLTNHVINFSYRPPELLLGSTKYGFEVDIWSMGCIFYEFINNRVLFQTENLELNQLQTIFSIVGYPDNRDWPEWESLPLASIFREKSKRKSRNLHSYFQKSENFPPEFSEVQSLLEGMLQLNPNKRLTAAEALLHPFFKCEGDEIDPISLPILTFPETHIHPNSEVLSKEIFNDLPLQ